ncbi:putative integral membrane protein [Rosellinia necatrix]|uniref:Putative integral membrane protein n=1 Tax=Rosellinia necatrix TaxID=77044 RepID=A0A1W2TAK3_ROSNE|nr:putative integral membrane protein [Rosellinia necatrix]
MDQLDLSQIPGAKPPPGVIPNFDNPYSLAPVCLIVISITLPLTVVFLGLRLYVRLRVKRTTGADDVLCAISVPLVISFCGITLSFLNNPVGPHQWNVPLSKITLLFQQLTVVSLVIYALGCLTVKCTLLLLYMRIFSPNPRARVMIWAGLIFIVTFYTISVIVSLATCLPRASDGGWLSQSRGSRCEKEDELFAEVQGIVGAITDIYVFIIPMTLLAKLRLSRKRKIGVYGIFFTGFLACVVSIINAVFRFIVFGSGDALWNEVPIYALCAAELNFGLLCACMPVVFVVFKGFGSKTVSWAAKIRSWTTRSKFDTDMDLYSAVEEGSLPSIPRGTLHGLRSFVRRAYRTGHTDTELTLTPSTQGEVHTHVSVDDEYHAHLQRPHAPAASRDGQGLKTWRLHRVYGPATATTKSGIAAPHK